MEHSRRNIHGSLSGLEGIGGGSARKHHSKPREHGGTAIGGQSSYGRSRDGGSAIGSRIGGRAARDGAESTSKLMDPQQREQKLKEKQMDEIKRK